VLTEGVPFHQYLTLVPDHDGTTIGWGKPGKDTDTLGAFFDELPDGGASIEAVSMDRGPAYAKAVRQRAPAAVICFDPFHVIKLAADALDAVRRQVWPPARCPISASPKRSRGHAGRC